MASGESGEGVTRVVTGRHPHSRRLPWLCSDQVTRLSRNIEREREGEEREATRPIGNSVTSGHLATWPLVRWTTSSHARSYRCEVA